MRWGLLVGIVALAACGGDDEPDVAVADPVAADDGGDDVGGDDDGGDDVGGGGEGEASGDATDAGSGGGPLADSYPACDLISLEDLTGRGIEVVSGPTQTEGDFGFDECTFADESGPAVLVSVFPPAEGSGAIGDEEEIPGIGARTTYSPAARTINVELDDGSLISIYVPGFLGPDDPRDILIELAEIAVG